MHYWPSLAGLILTLACARDWQVRTLTAASEAATHGEPALALHGYVAAFTLSRASPYLLAAANMLFKLGELDHAAAYLTYLAAADEGLSSDQRSVLLARQEQLASARAEQEALRTPAAGAPRRGLGSKRASVKHQLMDRQLLQNLQQPPTPATQPPAPLAGQPSPRTPNAAQLTRAASSKDVPEELEASDDEESETVSALVPGAYDAPPARSVSGRRRQGTEVGQKLADEL